MLFFPPIEKKEKKTYVLSVCSLTFTLFSVFFLNSILAPIFFMPVTILRVVRFWVSRLGSASSLLLFLTFRNQKKKNENKELCLVVVA